MVRSRLLELVDVHLVLEDNADWEMEMDALIVWREPILMFKVRVLYKDV
jgi:hypothetical protein